MGGADGARNASINPLLIPSAADANQHSLVMKLCDYCGRDSDDSLAQCRECGTPFFLPAPMEPAQTVTLPRVLSSSALIRRLVAVMMGAQAFCAFGEGRAADSTHGYIVLLAIVFTPVAFICCNARPCLINQILERIGWVLLLLFWVFAAGNM
jgi:hypothetical protein